MADQVDEIKAKTDIVSLISEHVDLKKAGSNYKGLCPFHQEKTPSFMVSPELQIFKCFGCGESGDAISFLEKHEGMDFYEALKFLAQRAGVKLKQDGFKKRGEKERFYEINQAASRFYQYILFEHESGKPALKYLTEKRGLNLDTIKKFKLGYSPDTPFALRKYLVEKKKIGYDEVQKAGIAYKKGSNYYDRFRGRVIFPLFDHRGNPVGFAGRILPKDENKDLAKYINSPETPVYHKSRILYGLNETKGDIKREGVVVIVEGELDVISSWQAGVKNVVATKGTALTEGQVRLLTRYAKSAVLCLDADLAGDEAARRGVTIAQNQGLEVGVARLGKFKDPDEAARKDVEAYKDAIEDATSVWDFIIDLIFSRQNEKTGSGKAKISKEIAPILASIDDDIVKAHYVKVVASRLEVPEEAVASQVANVKKDKEDDVPEVVVPEKSEGKSRRELLEERLLTLTFQSDPEILLKSEVKELIKSPLSLRIVEEYEGFSEEEDEFSASSFADTLPEELTEGFSEMMLKDVEGLIDSPDQLKKEKDVILRELKKLSIKEESEEVAKNIRKLEKEGNKKELKKAEERFAKLNEDLSSLEQSQTSGIIL